MRTPPALALYAVLALWVMLAASPLETQWARQSEMLRALGSAAVEQRAALVDNPAFPVAHAIADAVPPDACVDVAAYAGPAAIEYYNARFDYLLYPRRVRVAPDTTIASPDCGYLAVFRDTQQNLAAEPFAGQWDETALAERTQGAERLGGDANVMLYKLR
jgi:hypothetical protein